MVVGAQIEVEALADLAGVFPIANRVSVDEIPTVQFKYRLPVPQDFLAIKGSESSKNI